MTSSSSSSNSIIFKFVVFLLLASSFTTAVSEQTLPANQTFQPRQELLKLKKIRGYLKKINKPPIKTIQSPDGDLIDCVLSHLQPAFDHPQLKGMKPLEPPKRPKSNETINEMEESLQVWTVSGESCPEGTVPIRRTTEKDVLRTSSLRRFGRKIRRGVRHDTLNNDHE